MIEPTLSFQTIQDPPRVVLVRLAGEVNDLGNLSVDAAFNEILLATQPQHVVLDVRDLTFIDCRFIGSLLFWKEALSKRGGKLTMFGLCGSVECALRVLNLNRILAVCADYPTALAAVTNAEPDATARGNEP